MKAKQLLLNLPPHLRRDGELILAHLLGVKASQLPLLLESDVPPSVRDRFHNLLKRRHEGVPTAYLMGEWDFFGRTFRVKEGVLIPRPETELLVERVLPLVPENAVGFEIGCGSGCISVTLLLERKGLKMTACDVNPDALELTRENARLHSVEERIELLHGDMFQPVGNRRFDFVISNPPYVPVRRWEELPPEVRMEGFTSLVGGEKGYEFYERLCDEVRSHLKPGGFVALEIGHDQGEVVRALLETAGFKVMIYRDYAGQDRIALGWS